MRLEITPLLRAAAVAAGLAFLSTSHAEVTVKSAATDLADAVPGQDLWRYDYLVSGSFDAFGGLTFLFDASRHGHLSDPQPSGDPDWTLYRVDPDPTLAAPGLLTATASFSGTVIDKPFSVQFLWLAGGTPGAQPFEVFNDTFDIVDVGRTRLAGQIVPEPQSAALTALALLALLALLKRRRKN